MTDNITDEQRAAISNIWSDTVNLSHLASMAAELRGRPEDAANAVQLLERLTESVRTLYGSSSGSSPRSDIQRRFRALRNVIGGEVSGEVAKPDSL